MKKKKKGSNNLDKEDIEELAKFFDLLQKFDVEDKRKRNKKRWTN
jgi:hypothetical protein